MSKVGMTLNYKDLKVEWLGNTIPMESLNKPNALAAHVDSYLMQIEEDDLTFEDCYGAQEILDAKYEKVDVEEVANSCTHLTPKQREELKALMLRHTKLFDGTLGKYPGEPMHIELEKGMCQCTKDTTQFLGYILKPLK